MDLTRTPGNLVAAASASIGVDSSPYITFTMPVGFQTMHLICQCEYNLGERDTACDVRVVFQTDDSYVFIDGEGFSEGLL